MSELWDAYNENFIKIDGVVLRRGYEIPEGYYHLVSEVVIRHTSGEYLLMQRAPEKKRGGTWELSAGGSALMGESAMECGLREVKEETGIEVLNLREIGTSINKSYRTIFVYFFGETDCKKGSVTLQKGETSAYKWVSGETLIKEKESLASKRILGFLNI